MTVIAFNGFAHWHWKQQLPFLAGEKEGRQLRMNISVTGTGCFSSHDQTAKRKHGNVIVDASTGEIDPGFLTVDYAYDIANRLISVG